MSLYELTEIELDAVSAGAAKHVKKVEVKVAKAAVNNNQTTKFIAIKSVVIGVDNSNTAVNDATATVG